MKMPFDLDPPAGRAKWGLGGLLALIGMFVWGRSTRYGWTPWACVQLVFCVLLVAVMAYFAWRDWRNAQ